MRLFARCFPRFFLNLQFKLINWIKNENGLGAWRKRDWARIVVHEKEVLSLFFSFCWLFVLSHIFRRYLKAFLCGFFFSHFNGVDPIWFEHTRYFRIGKKEKKKKRLKFLFSFNLCWKMRKCCKQIRFPCCAFTRWQHSLDKKDDEERRSKSIVHKELCS